MRINAHALTLCLGLVAALASPAAAGWWDDAGGAKETTLAELRRDPEPWRDVTIVLPARFERVPERVNPFFTQFNPGSWQPLAVQAVGARDGAEIVFDRVFVRRGSETERRLGTLTAGEPLLLRGVVRDTVGDEPWIEVLRITRAADGLTPEEGARVTQADRFLTKSNPVAAEKLYRTVLDARRLGDAERAALRAKLGAALYAQGRLEDARTELSAALEFDPLDRATAERLERVTAALAAPKAAPPTARIARPAPELPAAPSEPLTLPGDRPRLAPPSGLDWRQAPTIPAASRTPAADAPAIEAVFPPEAPTLPEPASTPPEPPRGDAPAPVEAPRTGPVKTPEPPSADDVTNRLPAPPRRGTPAPAVEPKPTPPAPVRRAAPPAPPPESKPAPKPAPVEEEEEEPVPPLPSRPPLVGPK